MRMIGADGNGSKRGGNIANKENERKEKVIQGVRDKSCLISNNLWTSKLVYYITSTPQKQCSNKRKWIPTQTFPHLKRQCSHIHKLTWYCTQENLQSSSSTPAELVLVPSRYRSWLEVTSVRNGEEGWGNKPRGRTGAMEREEGGKEALKRGEEMRMWAEEWKEKYVVR